MAIDTALKALLDAALAGGGHNGANISASVVYPYAVFYELSGEPLRTIHGTTEATDSEYQVDVFARSPEQAKGLALGDVKDAIETSTTVGGVLTLSMSGEYDPVARCYRYISRYQVWET